MKGRVLKGSKSSVCSPVPIKIIGLLVAATLNVIILKKIKTAIKFK